MWSKLTFGLATLGVLFLLGCVSYAPVEEYTLARTALESARSIEAARYAPGHWHRAEESYRNGENLFKQGEYEEAEKELMRARLYAEKAETTARLLRFQSGEGGL